MESSTQTENVTLGEVLELATWNRPRSTDELLHFISAREDYMMNR